MYQTLVGPLIPQFAYLFVRPAQISGAGARDDAGLVEGVKRID